MPRIYTLDVGAGGGGRGSGAMLKALVPPLAVIASMLAVMATQAVGADDQPFRTAAGHEVPMPVISELDCRQMAIILEKIDATGYRPGNPNRIDPADRPLFNYERQLSAAHYESCSMGGSNGRKPLLHGFKLMTIPTSQ